MTSVPEVATAIRRVYDPELGIDVVSLGLIYGIEIDGDRVVVEMTTTTEGCPMGMVLFEGVGLAANGVEPGLGVEVRPVFEPRWSVEMMTEEARRSLGLPPRESN